MSERECNFNQHVRSQARDLLNEVKSGASTYGEIENRLRVFENTAKYYNPKNPYLVVISEAKSQLQKELYALNLRGE